MTRVLGVLTAAAFVVFAPGTALAQSGPAGDWELSMTTPQGTNTVGLSISLAGDKVSGDLSSQLGSVPVSGTATGNDLAVSAEVSMQGMALQFGITGKIDGDAMNGTVKVGDFGEFPFTGKRVAKAATAPAAAAAAAPAAATSAASGVSDAAAAPITDLNGKWDIKLAIAGMGEIPATAMIKQDGDKLTGTLSGPAGDLVIAGTVTGRTVQIDFEAETPQGKLPVTMTGDMGATSVTGKASIAGLGEADWTATRAAVQ
jgi:hypothetical protein